MLNDNRIRIIVGHYGSGKTEFAVNYSVKLAELGKSVTLADLDVVNPYFRSREKAEELEKLGVKVIGSSIKGNAVDVPSVSADVYGPLQDTSVEAVLDVGGDPVGARALGRYYNFFETGKYDMFFVVNANRPETQTLENVEKYIKEIERVSRAKVTGLINNTHLLKSTTVEDVLSGQRLVEEVSNALNIPIKYVSALENVAKNLPHDIKGEILPLNLYMREDWMI
ncbi:ATP-binding protein [Proteiniborus sp.]|uniref:ATP-binding protein n=1 Tax=Proteiniborus sp. TaxID=2079015 RepID=UPI00332A476F